MKLERHLHRLLLALSVLALLAYGASGPEGTLLAVLVIPLTIGAWWVTGPSPERAAPRVVVNTLLALICAYSIYRVLQLSISVRVFADFVTLLIPVKMLDRRGPRDAAQVISLVIFLVIGSILTDNTFETAMLMLAFIPACAYTMMVFQLWVAEDAARGVGGEAARSSPRLRRSLRGLTLLGLAMGLPITASAFILMPRNPSADAARAWGGAGTGQVTGFNDEIQLGRSGLISSSPEPVLDLELSSSSGERLGGQGQTFYLRGAVLDRYDPQSGRWSGDRGPRGDSVTRQPSDRADRGDRGFSPVGRRPEEWDVEQTITLRDSSQRGTHLFAIWRPKQVRVGLRYALDLQTRELRAVDPSGSITYAVRSLRQDPAAESPDRDAERSAQERPEIEFDLPVARERAVSVMEPLGLSPEPAERSWADDAAAAAAIENSFTRRGYRYTLDQVAPPPGREPIEWFLSDSREGHCEYFASGMAAMCRSVGINARVVTGYIATDYVPGSRHYVVRASNAHAWVEVQVGPDAWRRYDPSPSADLQRLHQPSQTLLAQLRGIYESIEYGWIRAVIGFDTERRDVLLGAELAESSEGVLGEFARRIDRAAEARPETLLLAGGRGLIAFFAVVVLGYSAVIGAQAAPRLPWTRGLGWLGAGGSVAARGAERLAGEIDRALRRLGLPRPRHRPILTHLRELDPAALDRDQADVLLDAARELARARYDPSERAGNTRLAESLAERARRVRSLSVERR